MPPVTRGTTLQSMIVTYSVSWRTGEGAATAGLLELTQDAVVLTTADGVLVEEVPFADISAVRRWSATVELERRTGDPIWIESVAAGVFGAHLEASVESAKTLGGLRAEHDRIDDELAELRVAVGCLADIADGREHEIALLATDLMRRIVEHAHIEERDLYPAIEQLRGGPPLVAAMVFDHRAIEGEIRDLIRIDSGDREQLACLFHRLDALLTTHIAKEETVVFPLLESR